MLESCLQSTHKPLLSFETIEKSCFQARVTQISLTMTSSWTDNQKYRVLSNKLTSITLIKASLSYIGPTGNGLHLVSCTGRLMITPHTKSWRQPLIAAPNTRLGTSAARSSSQPATFNFILSFYLTIFNTPAFPFSGEPLRNSTVIVTTH